MEFKKIEEVNIKTLLQFKQYLMLPLLTVVVILGLFILVVSPNIQGLVVLQRQIKLDTSEFKALESKLNSLRVLDDGLLDEQVKMMEEVLPSSKTVLKWINSFSGLAADTGVILGSFTLNPGSIASESAIATSSAGMRTSEVQERAVSASDPQQRKKAGAAGDLEHFSVNLEVNGAYPQVREYVMSLEKIAPLVRMANLKISQEEGNRYASLFSGLADQDRIKGEMQILVFYTPNKPVLGSVSQPITTATESELALYAQLKNLKTYAEASPTAFPLGKEDIFASF